jgi:hypothetical protein
MTSARATGPDLRSWLRRPGDALPGASIGTVPILWYNVDIAELRLGTDAPPPPHTGPPPPAPALRGQNP